MRHLIHIGYAKAGTHFVQRWFASHPQLLYAPAALAGAKTTLDLVDQCVAPSTKPQHLWRITSSERMAAPAGPEAGGQADAQRLVCAGLAQVFPDATIMLLTRGFRSLLVSGYSQSVRQGRQEEFLAFHDATEAQLRWAATAWNYDQLLQIYREAFGGRVIVLPYELLRDDPDAFVGELEKRLDVVSAPVATDRIYPSLSGVEMRWYPRITRMVNRLPLRGRVGERLRRSYVRSIDRNAWRHVIAGLQRILPAKPVEHRLIPDEAVEFFRGRADLLRHEPIYAPYAADYLFDA